MLFLGIISWKGTSYFNNGGERGVVFQLVGGASFLSGGGAQWGALVLMGGFKKSCWMGGCLPPPLTPTMGNPETLYKKGFVGRDGMS